MEKAQQRKQKYMAAFLILGGGVLLLLLANLCIGTVSIPAADILASMRGEGGTNTGILWNIRMPRAIAAMVLGGALALAGYLLQTFSTTRSPGRLCWGFPRAPRWWWRF